MPEDQTEHQTVNPTANHEHYQTASDLMLSTLREAGVDCIFANLGSDHPAIIESWAKFRDQGIGLPEIVICPHEMVALSAAHGYAQSSGKLQAVFVHVDVGTQNLGGAVHNAKRCRVPVFIFAGASPVTLDGERMGSRNEFIHYLQDVFDQRGIIREYTKWDYDLHAGENIDLVVKRALQIANSEPRGPVYLMAPREMLEVETPIDAAPSRILHPIQPSGLAPKYAAEIAEALINADFPLILTTYLGRNHEAVNQLVELADQLAIPVMEAGPYYTNFPANHPLHLGYEDYFAPNPYLEKADVVLVLDSDIPWMPQKSHLSPGSRLYWIDSDPVKEGIPLWYYSEQLPLQADSCTALQQIRQHVGSAALQLHRVEQRRRDLHRESVRLREQWKLRENLRDSEVITPEFLTATLHELIDEDTIVLTEAISNYGVVWRHLPRTKPGTLFGSGASSLGWHGGAAIGVKLANPDKTVVAVTGDGSYVFSVPTAVHWMSKRYQAPFLTVIYNNGGWKSPKLSTLAVHPRGVSSRNSDFHVDFSPTLELEQVAGAASGTYIAKVTNPQSLRGVLSQALTHVEAGQSAVVNVILETL